MGPPSRSVTIAGGEVATSTVVVMEAVSSEVVTVAASSEVVTVVVTVVASTEEVTVVVTVAASTEEVTEVVAVTTVITANSAPRHCCHGDALIQVTLLELCVH